MKSCLSCRNYFACIDCGVSISDIIDCSLYVEASEE